MAKRPTGLERDPTTAREQPTQGETKPATPQEPEAPKDPKPPETTDAAVPVTAEFICLSGTRQDIVMEGGEDLWDTTKQRLVTTGKVRTITFSPRVVQGFGLVGFAATQDVDEIAYLNGIIDRTIIKHGHVRLKRITDVLEEQLAAAERLVKLARARAQGIELPKEEIVSGVRSTVNVPQHRGPVVDPKVVYPFNP